MTTKIKLSNNVTDVDLVSSPPTNGQALVYSSTTSKWAPGSVAASGGGVTVYDTLDDLPLSGNDAGVLALVSSTSRLYIWIISGETSGWYNIAAVNTAPNITGGYQDKYFLSAEGEATVLTLIGSDPEGLPLTWSYEVTAGSLTNNGGTTATIVQNDNVFTVTPTTNLDYWGTFTVTFRATDGVNLSSVSSEFKLAFEIDNSKYTSFLLKATAATDNSTYTDPTGLTADLVATGDLTQGSISPYSPNHSIYFDGTASNYCYFAASSDFDMDTSEWCLETWIYVEDLSADRGIAATWQGGGQFGFKVESDGGLTFSIRDQTDTTAPAGTITENTWYHIAVVRDNSGASDVVSIYVDGVSVGSQSFTSGTDFIYYNDALKDFRIGVYFDAGTPFKGYINNFRFVIGASVYTSNFDIPYENLESITGTRLLVANRAIFDDMSSYRHTLLITETPTFKYLPTGPYNYGPYRSTQVGSSSYFSGLNSTELRFTPQVDYSLPGDFTIEGWMYWPNTPPSGSPDSLFTVRNGTQYFDFRYYNGNWQVSLNAGSGTNISTYDPVADRWYHVALVRSTGGIINLYINGRVEGTLVNNEVLGYSVPTNAAIGGQGSGGNLMSGYISDVRVVKNVAVYTQEFIPPTSPLDQISGTILIQNKFSGAGLIDGSQRNQLILSDVTGSNAVTKFNSFSAYFNGTSYAINNFISSNSFIDNSLVGNSLTLGTHDFTIEGWIYPTVIGPTVIGSENTIVTLGPNVLRVSLRSGKLSFYNGTSWISTTTVLSANTWHYFAAVRQAGILKLLVNGTEEYSGTDSTAYLKSDYAELELGATDTSGIGATFTSLYTGYMEDIRVTKGLARLAALSGVPTSQLRA